MLLRLIKMVNSFQEKYFLASPAGLVTKTGTTQLGIPGCRPGVGVAGCGGTSIKICLCKLLHGNVPD